MSQPLFHRRVSRALVPPRFFLKHSADLCDFLFRYFYNNLLLAIHTIPSGGGIIGVVTSGPSTRLTCSSGFTVSPWRHRDNSISNFSTLPLYLAAFSFSRSYRRFHSSAVNSSFTQTTFLIVFARLPEWNE